MAKSSVRTPLSLTKRATSWVLHHPHFHLLSEKRPGPSNVKLNSQDLDKIAEVTLDFYNRHAEDFWEGTRDHDVSQNITAILQHIEGKRPFTILDFGCGPGRDL